MSGEGVTQDGRDALSLQQFSLSRLPVLKFIYIYRCLASVLFPYTDHGMSFPFLSVSNPVSSAQLPTCFSSAKLAVSPQMGG